MPSTPEQVLIERTIELEQARLQPVRVGTVAACVGILCAIGTYERDLFIGSATAATFFGFWWWAISGEIRASRKRLVELLCR